eukprot:29229-Eustigmatos_ZCMA.PRE.1
MQGARYPLVDPKRQSSQGLGSIALHGAELIARPSFLDYIRGGCEINFMVAIDFTAVRERKRQGGHVASSEAVCTMCIIVKG